MPRQTIWWLRLIGTTLGHTLRLGVVPIDELAYYPIFLTWNFVEICPDRAGPKNVWTWLLGPGGITL